jgi:hypothetical protein
MGDGAWPPNRGFITATKTTLKLAQRLTATVVGPMQMVSTIVVRLYPLRDFHSRRALQQNTLNKPYSVYEVVKPLPVDSGPAIPWFGQPGRGTQYETSEAIETLIENGF